MGNGSKEQRFYTVDQVADSLGVSTRTVWRLIDSGDLVVHRIAGSVRISGADLGAYINQCRDDHSSNGSSRGSH